MRFEAALKRALSGINPWIPLFAFTGLFQYLRGAYFDTIYFAVVVTILVVDWKRWFPYQFPKKPQLSLWSAAFTAALIAMLLFAIPRKSEFEVALMIAIFLSTLALVWYKDSGPTINMDAALNRTEWLWITLGILISLWELFAYILSDVADDSYAYPTVSILMSPIMASDWGRAGFALLWLLIGIALLRIRRRR